jgi:hypothetical protein
MALSTEPQAQPSIHPSRAERLRRYFAGLFPEASATTSRMRTVVLAVIGVAVGTGVSLARTTGAGPFQTIWEEDARDLLSDALMRPGAFNVIKPYVGYFQVGPRLLAEVATFFPISWAAAVLSIEAAILTALLTLAVYVASGTHLDNPWARFMVAAPMLFAPTAENILSEIYNRPATIQFFIVYAVFWLLLWVPARPLGQAVLLLVVGLSAASTFLVVLFIPLAALRLYVRRDRISLALFGFLVAGAATQVAGLYFGLTNRAFVVPRYEPLWAVSSYVTWALPQSLLGFRLDNSGTAGLVRVALIGVPWLIVAAIACLAVRRVTRPAWLLAIVAAAHSVALACMTIMANGQVTQRYLLPVEMLLFTALVALLMPSDRWSRVRAHVPLVVFTTFVLIVSGFNYRWHNTYRAQGPLWTEQVKLAAISCQAPGRREALVRSGPAPWYSLVRVPCHVLNKTMACQDPYCVQIGAPRLTGRLGRDNG